MRPRLGVPVSRPRLLAGWPLRSPRSPVPPRVSRVPAFGVAVPRSPSLPLVSLDPTGHGLTEVTTKPSPRSVADTVARLSETVDAKGMKEMCIRDSYHRGGNGRSGRTAVEWVVVIFRAPGIASRWPPSVGATPPRCLDTSEWSEPDPCASRCTWAAIRARFPTCSRRLRTADRDRADH